VSGYDQSPDYGGPPFGGWPDIVLAVAIVAILALLIIY
jgi:hypothetical protein